MTFCLIYQLPLFSRRLNEDLSCSRENSNILKQQKPKGPSKLRIAYIHHQYLQDFKRLQRSKSFFILEGLATAQVKPHPEA